MLLFEPIRNQQLAAAFLKQQPPYSLVCDNECWYRYSNRLGWQHVTSKQMENILSRFLMRTLDGMRMKNGKPVPGSSFTISRMKDVLACVKAMVSLPLRDEPTPDPAVFLKMQGDEMVTVPATGWISTVSHQLDVAGVAQAMYRNEEIPASMLRNVDSRLFSPGRVPCRFDPGATCPRWQQFVREVCPDDAKTLQMMFGLSLTYDRRYNVFFVVNGEAGTGKSTALNVLGRLNAGVTSNVSLSQFGVPFHEFPLTLNRLNLVHDMDAVSETGTGVTRRESVLKSCTCGEMKAVDEKFENPVSRHLSAMPVFGCNTLPRFVDRSNAISERMRIITLPNVFRNTDAQDNNLIDTLTAELSGILNWSLCGLGELLSSGARVFPESESAQRTKIEAIKASRPEELFCDEYLEKDTGGYLSTDLVYQCYGRYCIRNGFHTQDSSIIIPAIQKYLNVTKKRKGSGSDRRYSYIGIAFQEWFRKRNDFPE